MTSTTKYLFLSALMLPALVLPADAQALYADQAPPAPVSRIVPEEGAPAAPPPAHKHKHRFQVPKIGVDFGTFVPSDGKTRSRFGKSWSSFGIGFGRPDRPSGSGRVGLDFSLTTKNSGDHHVFAAPIGVSYRRAFSAADVTNEHTFIPYYGVSVDLVALDLRSPEDNVHSGVRLSEGGSVAVGTTVGKSGFLEGRYIGVARTEGFNLSGFNLTAGIRF